MTRYAPLSPTARHSYGNLPVLVAGVALAVLLGGCGQTTGSSAGGPAAQSIDRGDARFVSSVIVRQGQAQMMEGWAARRTNSPSVRALTSRMMHSQRGWDHALKACAARWKDSHQGGMMGSPGPMMGGDDRGGMMSRTDLSGLRASSGPAFDRKFLQMMIRHHTSMITLAAAETTAGSDPRAVRLARQIHGSQSRELVHLRQLLGR